MKSVIFPCLTMMLVSILAAACPAAAAGDGGPGGGALPEMRVVNLADRAADASDLLAVEDGRYSITGYGREAHFGNDEGTFVGFQTEAPHFTFTARIAGAEFDSPNAKYGLTIREGLEGFTRAFSIRYDAWEGNRCLQWFMRHHRAHDAHFGGLRAWVAGSDRTFEQQDGFYLRIVRRYPYLRAYASEDGQDWTDVTNYHAALLEKEVWVGMQVTAGGQGRPPMEAVFEDIRFTVDEADTGDRRATFTDHKPNVRTRMYLVRMESDRGDEVNPFVLIPEGMDRSEIRALYWTPGNKEVALYPNIHMPWENGPGRLRRPEGMEDWEGVWTFEADALYRGLAQHGIVRLGGVWSSRDDLDDVLEALAEATGIEHLPDLPFIPAGISAMGGASARISQTWPQRTIAAIPTLIGAAGMGATGEEVLAVPRLYIIGSRDGAHLRQVIEANEGVRERGALWGTAVMWTVHHQAHKLQAIALPYMIDMTDARLPERLDRRPIELRPLREEDGYFGLIDTWESNFPKVVPVREFDGDRSRAVWLPNAHIARIWQAFCSNHPQTVIHFPRFDGHGGFGNAPRANLDWRNSHLVAGEPIEVMASGPDADDVEVTWYAGLEQLEVIREHDGNPFRVTLEPLPAGTHALYAITRIGEQREISRPVTVMVHEPQQ